VASLLTTRQSDFYNLHAALLQTLKELTLGAGYHDGCMQRNWQRQRWWLLQLLQQVLSDGASSSKWRRHTERDRRLTMNTNTTSDCDRPRTDTDGRSHGVAERHNYRQISSLSRNRRDVNYGSFVSAPNTAVSLEDHTATCGVGPTRILECDSMKTLHNYSPGAKLQKES